MGSLGEYLNARNDALLKKIGKLQETIAKLEAQIKTGSHVVVSANLYYGVDVFGPFTDEAQAFEWGNRNCPEWRWRVMNLQFPENSV